MNTDPIWDETPQQSNDRKKFRGCFRNTNPETEDKLWDCFTNDCKIEEKNIRLPWQIFWDASKGKEGYVLLVLFIYQSKYPYLFVFAKTW